MSVEDGEETDQQSGKRQWRPDLKHYGCPQDDG